MKLQGEDLMECVEGAVVRVLDDWDRNLRENESERVLESVEWLKVLIKMIDDDLYRALYC